jgi:hypothetical protein
LEFLEGKIQNMESIPDNPPFMMAVVLQEIIDQTDNYPYYQGQPSQPFLSFSLILYFFSQNLSPEYGTNSPKIVYTFQKIHNFALN